MNEPFLEPILRSLRVKKVISHIPPSSNVLDIGCGVSANFLMSISPYISQGYGIDFKVDTNIDARNITLKQIFLDDKLPFLDNSFQVVTMLAVLEHIENDREILTEIYRVLEPNGKLIITVPSTLSQPILEFFAYRLKIISEDEIKDHKRYYNREKLQQVLIKDVGFRKFEHHYFQLGMNNFCTVLK
jgi:ubiquinone/menaquinone biosynthesis C-methylase UbiE